VKTGPRAAPQVNTPPIL